eukprot:7428571-Pyramimonas_sp.AAC.1
MELFALRCVFGQLDFTSLGPAMWAKDGQRFGGRLMPFDAEGPGQIYVVTDPVHSDAFALIGVQNELAAVKDTGRTDSVMTTAWREKADTRLAEYGLNMVPVPIERARLRGLGGGPSRQFLSG